MTLGISYMARFLFLKELNLIGKPVEVSCNYHMAELELELTAKDSSLCFPPPKHIAISKEFELH